MQTTNEPFEKTLPSWNHTHWLSQFRDAINPRYMKREFRVRVYENTMEIVQAGKYLSASGQAVTLDMDAIEAARRNTVFYADTREIPLAVGTPSYETQVFAIEADCLEVAKLLILSGYHPAVLNMANPMVPGGGVVGGSGAQEENLFRRSTAYYSLYQFVDFGQSFAVPRDPDRSYPIPDDFGGIYSPDVMVFRSSENTGYYLLDSPYSIGMITVAAIFNPPVVRDENALRLVHRAVEATKERIRTILRIGMKHGHDAMVLSAFGCGAFANPPEHMAELFREVLAEEAFCHAFKMIVFAIVDDSNTFASHNPQGNVLPFQMAFNE